MKKRILAYLFFFTLGWCLISLSFGYAAGKMLSKRPHSLQRKLEVYAANVEDYDLLFIGDSRTYCGIHPELVDATLKAHALNLSTWANWLPSQYLFVRALLPQIPENTTVVWTLGRGNFSDDAFRDKFPMSVDDVLLFYRLGLPTEDIIRGFASHHPLLMLPLKRTPVFDRVDALMDRPFYRFGKAVASASLAGSETTEPSSYPPDEVLETLSRSTMYDSGKATSLEYKTIRGGSCRYELDMEFFHSKEISNSLPAAEAKVFRPQKALPSTLYLLNETLKAFHDANINLILNIIEDSPYTYYNGNQLVRQTYRDFLNALIKDAAKPFGFPVVMVDQSKYSDADYFDHNHLNFKGISKYSPALAETLAPYHPRP